MKTRFLDEAERLVEGYEEESKKPNPDEMILESYLMGIVESDLCVVEALVQKVIELKNKRQ